MLKRKVSEGNQGRLEKLLISNLDCSNKSILRNQAVFQQIIKLNQYDENILGKENHNVEEISSRNSLPSFVSDINTTVVSSVGQTVYFYCGVHNLGDRQVRTEQCSHVTVT